MRRPWLAPVMYLLPAAGLLGALAAGFDDQRTRLVVAAAPVLAACAGLSVVVRHRPVRPVPWMLLSLGLLASAASSVVAAYGWLDPVSGSSLGSAEAFGVLAFPALAVGTLGIQSANRRQRDLLGGSGPIIYTLAATSVVWVLVTGPYLEARQMPLSERTWVWIFPIAHVALAIVSLARGRRAAVHPLAHQVLALGYLLWGAGMALVTWRVTGGGSVEQGRLSLTMAGPLVVGLSMVLPGSEEPSAPSTAVDRARWIGFGGLVLAALTPLAALIALLVADVNSPSSLVIVSATTVAVVLLAMASMWRLVGEVRSLTEQRGRDRLAAIVEHSSDVVMLADHTGRISYASPGLRVTLGHQPESWVGRHLLDIVVEADRAGGQRQLERLVEFGSGGVVEFEVGVQHADGQHRKATVVIANLIGGAAVDGIVATFRDVTEQRNLERQLSHRAFHDELTGLANRALFLDRMDHALRITRSEADPVVVLFVDLDDFKSVNDALGHVVGDQLLKVVADRIRRASGGGDTAARLGGDEFAMLLEDRGGIDRAIDVAERLLDSLRDPVTIAGFDVTVLASVGIAVALPGTSTNGLLRDADIAMYEAKRAGKGQVRIFDPAMRLVAAKHLEYRGDLGLALERQQLRLVYMPFVDLKTGQVVGAEALLRWQHHGHGDVPAHEFVPIAERSGLIVPIGWWALDQGFAELARWRANLFATFNVSSVQLRQPDFVERVVELADSHRIDRSAVVFELTETTLVEEPDRAEETVRRLREEGFRLALDDFGAGYCSLSYLQRHPVDLLKIDRAAIVDFGADPRGNTLARTILQMAGALDMVTVAEGIETTHQLRELRRHGCDLGQGYLLSRPIEADQLLQRFGYRDVLAPLTA